MICMVIDMNISSDVLPQIQNCHCGVVIFTKIGTLLQVFGQSKFNWKMIDEIDML